MADVKLQLRDGNSAIIQSLARDNGDSSVTPYHIEDSVQRSALIAAVRASIDGDATFVPSWKPNTQIITTGFSSVIVGVDAIDPNTSISIFVQLSPSTLPHQVLPLDFSTNCSCQPIVSPGTYFIAAAGLVTYQITGGAATVNALLKR